MRAITKFVSGLLLSAMLLLPVSAHAAELQPFLTVKVSSVNTLISIADKIGTMAGYAQEPQYREFINNVRASKGIDFDGIFGVAVAVDGDGDLTPVFLLPITDLMKAEIAGEFDPFDSLRPFLTKKGDGFLIDAPMSLVPFYAAQKKDYLVVSLEPVASQVPADAKKMFADLEKYTIGMKLDLEKIKWDTLEAKVFGPWKIMIAMFNPDAADQIESALEIYEKLYKEIATMSGGVVFNAQTADVDFSTVTVARKDSEMAKMYAGVKMQPTMFGAFRGTPENTIASFGASMTVGQSKTIDVLVESTLKDWDVLFSGLLEQVEEDDDTGEIGKLAKEAYDLVKKIFMTEAKRLSSDLAGSMSVDGTVMMAFDTGSLPEVQKLANLAMGFTAKRIGEVSAATGVDAKTFIEKNIKSNYVTVEGFKVSSFKIALSDSVFDALNPGEEVPKAIKDMTLGVFWAVKEGDKQAIALAAGLDFDKTEAAFKSALEKTKTPVLVQQPIGAFSVQGLGKFLNQTVYSIAQKAGAPQKELGEMKRVFDIIAAAGNDATVKVTVDFKPDREEDAMHISGKAIQTIISAVKEMIKIEEENRARWDW
jgi:hypothetical protein